MDSEEAAVLLLATLIHDIGMLSQSPQDLEGNDVNEWAQNRMELAEWVRKTHIIRTGALVRRLLSTSDIYSVTENCPFLDRAIRIARMHGSWPWTKQYKNLDASDQFLVAVLAAADLFDEDANRCDTQTLIEHRYGNTHNKAHWLRHGLSRRRVTVTAGTVLVEFQTLPDVADVICLEPVFTSLRNLYRLATAYNRTLMLRKADFALGFSPESGCPRDANDSLRGWNRIPGFATEKQLTFQLLRSFFPEALLDERILDGQVRRMLVKLKLEPVNLVWFNKIRGDSEIRSPIEEETIAATLE